jgi:hypothetical protein
MMATGAYNTLALMSQEEGRHMDSPESVKVGPCLPTPLRRVETLLPSWDYWWMPALPFAEYSTYVLTDVTRRCSCHQRC